MSMSSRTECVPWRSMGAEMKRKKYAGRISQVKRYSKNFQWVYVSFKLFLSKGSLQYAVLAARFMALFFFFAAFFAFHAAFFAFLNYFFSAFSAFFAAFTAFFSFSTSSAILITPFLAFSMHFLSFLHTFFRHLPNLHLFPLHFISATLTIFSSTVSSLYHPTLTNPNPSSPQSFPKTVARSNNNFIFIYSLFN